MNRKGLARGAPMVCDHAARHALWLPEWLLARDLAAADLAPDVGDMAGIAALPKDERIASPAFAPGWDAP